MVAVYSKTSGDFTGTRLDEPRSNATARPARPSASPHTQFRDDYIQAPQPATPESSSPESQTQESEAPDITGRFFTPFVAQVLAQYDTATRGDPREVAAAYRRATEVRFEPLDILPPV